MDKEKNTYHKLHAFYKSDKNIEVAILNGSRVNINVSKDFMQDYDIGLFVKNLDSSLKYIENQEWIHDFGNLVIVQQNQLENNAFIFLLQYNDGLRIDLSFHSSKYLKEYLEMIP